MAQIQKGTTYSTGDQVTATNLNALADAAILLPGAITDQTAKTVPLAADTVLIHSAADTALRKSTLTQLFSNATGIPISTGISGLGTGIATFLATPSSANLAAALTDETGSGAAVFATSPTLVTPALGTPSALVGTNITGTATAFNINGTVGATTASTGAFTTLSATGITLSTGDFVGNSGTQILGDNGTVGAPFFSFDGDADTGAYHPAANRFGIAAGGSLVGDFTASGLAVTGALSSTTGANFATSSGNVGIGTSSPTKTLQVVGDGRFTSDLTCNLRLFINSASYEYALRTNTSSSSFEIVDWNTTLTRIAISTAGAVRFNAYGAGALTTDASGNITAASDERIKSNIRPFSRGLTEILAINPILHGYTEESGLDQSRDDYAGFSAQQVQSIIPEAIGVNADGMLSFSDRPVMAALVNAMKELNANLVAELQSVRQRLAALEA